MIDLLPHVEFVFRVHQQKPCRPENAFRLWDGKTPYSIHPIWCAITLLTETTLPEDIRENGALALLYHDILEDTAVLLPKSLPTEVIRLVKEMTFAGGFSEEKTELLKKEPTVLLYKLYDKTSNLLDAAWMDPIIYQAYFEFTQKLCRLVEKKYGVLNITRIFHSLPYPGGKI